MHCVFIYISFWTFAYTILGKGSASSACITFLSTCLSSVKKLCNSLHLMLAMPSVCIPLNLHLFNDMILYTNIPHTHTHISYSIGWTRWNSQYWEILTYKNGSFMCFNLIINVLKAGYPSTKFWGRWWEHNSIQIVGQKFSKWGLWIPVGPWDPFRGPWNKQFS